MKKYFFITSLFLVSIFSIAQGTWTQKTSFGGLARGYIPAGFSIGTKAYVGVGYNSSTYYNDFWEWDQTTDTWTQKANYTGAGRIGTISFAINGKGYVGTGSFVSSRYNTFYEYNPTTNVWTQKANFPGTARCNAIAFSIGNKGYVGAGGNGFTSVQYGDFFEYNPSNNTWTAKSNFATMAREGAVGFSIGDKGYVGMGWRYSNGYQQDLWEYDTTSNAWTQKANFPGSARTGCSAFSIGTKAYVGMGYNGSSEQQNFYEWDQATNTWTVKANFGGGNRASLQRGLSVGNKGYAGLGYNGTSYFNDWWEYNPLDALSATVTPVAVSCNGQCTGSATAIPTGGQSPYSYSWSDGQTVATATNLCAGNYTVTITDANLTVVTVSTNITQPTALVAGASAANSTLCSGGCTNLIGIANGGTPAYSYLWMPNAATTPNTNVCPTASDTFSLIVTDAHGCSDTQAVVVTVNALPNVSYVESQTTVCINWNAITLSQGSPAGGTYSGPGVTGNQFDPAVAGQGTWTIIYTYTDSNNCSASASQQVTVDLCTGISSGGLNSGVKIFPDPFSNLITVNADNFSGGEIKIYDVWGREVFVTQMTASKTEIDLPGLSPGIYYVKVINGNFTWIKPVLKQ
jgi:N-acetylneuraminic acid mutarotase